MKTISQIAKESGCTYDSVYRVILNNNLVPVSYTEKNRFYAKIQIDFIFKILYFEMKCNLITLESSMNKLEKLD